MTANIYVPPGPFSIAATAVFEDNYWHAHIEFHCEGRDPQAIVGTIGYSSEPEAYEAAKLAAQTICNELDNGTVKLPHGLKCIPGGLH